MHYHTVLLRIFWVSCLIVFISRPSFSQENIFTVGIVPQFEAPQINSTWLPILEQLTQISGVQLKLKTSPSIPMFEKEFEDGNFDFAYMNPYHLIEANKKQGYIPIVRDVGRNLFGIIVVKKDSPIQNISELDGKTIAFPAPNALGAALIPRAEFKKKFNININELYVRSHSSVYYNVLLDQAAAGGGVQKTLSQQPEKIKNNLRVLYRTSEVPSHPFACHPRVGETICNTIADAFIKLGTTEEGTKLLRNIPINKIGRTALSDYHSLGSMGLSEFYIRQ